MNKVITARGACGGFDLGIGRIGASVADVLADGAVKQPGVLQHHGKLAAQCRAVPVAHIDALDTQRAAVHVVEALQQLNERGLAGAGGADDGDGLAGLRLAAKVVDDDLVGRVAKLDMVKHHVAGALLGNLRVGLLLLLGRGQELKDALGGGSHRLHRVAHVAQLLHGLRKVANVLDKALDVAGRGIAGQRELRAHHDDAHVAHVAHQAHKRHHQARQELRAPATNKEAVVLTVELFNRGLGAVEHLNDVLAGKVLLDNAVDGAQNLLLLAEVRLREVNHHGQDNRGGRQREHGDAGKRQADRKHHDEHADNLRHRRDELRHALVERLTQRIDVVGDAAEYVALAVAVEVTHWNDSDLGGDLLAHAIADLLRDTGHEPALDQAADRARQIQTEQKAERLGDPVKVNVAGAVDLGDQAFEQFGGNLAEHLGSHNIKDDRAHGKGDGGKHGNLVLADIPEQLPHGALKVLGLFATAHATHAAHGTTLAGGLGNLSLGLVCH